MWKSKRKLSDKPVPAVRLVLPEAAIRAVFDECDGFDRDETGGRVIGTVTENNMGLTLHISGIIGPGPRAQRSPVSFFQDGEYQEGVFRKIEKSCPEIEHLGTWHTHHVNGLQTLSSGDVTTYRRTVNHPKHNIPYFYALLVTAKHENRAPLQRYSMKHFLFRRGDDDFFEIPPEAVEITKETLLWPASDDGGNQSQRQPSSSPSTAIAERANDRAFLSEFYPSFRSLSSPKLGLYWRGTLTLADDSGIEVVVIEDGGEGAVKYTVAIRKPPESLTPCAEELTKKEFATARAALMSVERFCNRSLLLQLHKS